MKRLWRDAVLDAVQRQSGVNHQPLVTRQQLIAHELPTILIETQAAGVTPAQTLSYELQQLRHAGLLAFLGRGNYRLINPVVDAETFDGTQARLSSLMGNCPSLPR
jgi:hypothetical protein